MGADHKTSSKQLRSPNAPTRPLLLGPLSLVSSVVLRAT
ncbi:hypothetical protein KGM_203364 [Danaus plexippus plexippus]|uniref:Uncharacterized protein n=1 Tax=Danaus plexippus plexippus TaxID=278856 RepID=A0A212EQL4_DANPL|nr:hypothetical protein KGM_203364 [Danaus plexippus plexippus]